MELTQQDRAKFYVLSRKEGLKEGERMLIKCIE